MKKKLLIISRYFFPAFRAGGPAKSVTYMTNLIKNNYSVSVICSSRDLGSKIHMNVHKINGLITIKYLYFMELVI